MGVSMGHSIGALRAPRAKPAERPSCMIPIRILLSCPMKYFYSPYFQGLFIK